MHVQGWDDVSTWRQKSTPSLLGLARKAVMFTDTLCPLDGCLALRDSRDFRRQTLPAIFLHKEPKLQRVHLYTGQALRGLRQPRAAVSYSVLSGSPGL